MIQIAHARVCKWGSKKTPCCLFSGHWQTEEGRQSKLVDIFLSLKKMRNHYNCPQKIFNDILMCQDPVTGAFSLPHPSSLFLLKSPGTR